VYIHLPCIVAGPDGKVKKSCDSLRRRNVLRHIARTDDFAGCRSGASTWSDRRSPARSAEQC